MFKITIKKTVEETYILERDALGREISKDQALRLASTYAQLSDTELRGNIAAYRARVGNSQKVLGLKDIEVEELHKIVT